MSPSDESERPVTAPPADQGVLSNLPRTRPQRASPRRAAAREAGANGAKPNGATPRRAPGAKTSRVKPAGKAAATKPSTEVPRQGFECEDERVGGSVAPPGATELLASAIEVVNELAKAGASAGERLLKDVASLLPRR